MGGVGRGVAAIIFTNTHFHQDIPYGYLVMACKRTALEIHHRDITKTRPVTGTG